MNLKLVISVSDDDLKTNAWLENKLMTVAVNFDDLRLVMIRLEAFHVQRELEPS